MTTSKRKKESVVIEFPIVKGQGDSREKIRDSLGSWWPTRLEVKFTVNLSEEVIRLINERTLATVIQLQPGKHQISCVIDGMERANTRDVKDGGDWTDYINHIFILKGELCFQGSARAGVKFTIPLYRTDKRTGTVRISPPYGSGT